MRLSVTIAILCQLDKLLHDGLTICLWFYDTFIFDYLLCRDFSKSLASYLMFLLTLVRNFFLLTVACYCCYLFFSLEHH